MRRFAIVASLGSPVLLAVLVVSGVTAFSAMQPASMPLDDVERLQRSLVSLTQASNEFSAVSASQAMTVGNQRYDWAAIGASVDSYLASATDLTTLGTGAEIRNRDVWIIHAHGFQLEQAGPIGALEIPGATHILRHAYLLIDAVSGEFLVTLWTE